MSTKTVTYGESKRERNNLLPAVRCHAKKSSD